MQTHTVFNQASPLLDYDMFNSDRVLVELVSKYAPWALDRLSRFGRYAGSAEAISWAIQANDNKPVLETHDRFGHRVDRVDFHPAYHELMSRSIEFGVHALPWQEKRSGAHVARAAMMYMDFQNEAGHCCPISMTYSCVPSLRRQPELAQLWEPLINASTYDKSFLPANQKNGITIGMAMTEKQGGSDVRANTTRAVPLSKAEGGPGKEYLLTGHKWFCSAPMSDAFMVLAQTEKGISCFLLPRFTDRGINKIHIQRLKDKLGNRSNASSEIELDEAVGFLVGEEGRGVPTIIEMVNHTRLDCIIGSTALMRQASMQAIHHCGERSAFGKLLSEQNLMINVLADLALEAEAALRMTMRVAAAYDSGDESEKHFKRIASAIAKYWVCKRTPMHVAEALECLGGNGYVESGPMPRLFRESPLLGIWEGSGNVICLDVLRAVGKEPETLDAFVHELEKSTGLSAHLDRGIEAAKTEIRIAQKALSSKDSSQIEKSELGARGFVEKLALILQSVLMANDASQTNAETFIHSRLLRENGLAYGTLSGAGQNSGGLRDIIGHFYSQQKPSRLTQLPT